MLRVGINASGRRSRQRGAKMIALVPVTGAHEGLRLALEGAHLPVDDLDDPGRSFFRIERDGECLGYGGFELYGEIGLLRSIGVPEHQRGSGAGRLLVDRLIAEMATSGVKQVFLRTATAAGFFEHLGFRRVIAPSCLRRSSAQGRHLPSAPAPRCASARSRLSCQSSNVT